MTSHAPAPDGPDSATEPGQAPAADLLNGAALPATTAGTAATGPKDPSLPG